MTARHRAIVLRAAALLLRYPDEEVLTAQPTLSAALAELPANLATPLRTVVAHRDGTSPTALASEYVELFDFRRRCCLYLTYYSCGDTRDRGSALVAFASAFRAAGLDIVGGELPDFLPAVLDLASVDDAGWRLLRDNRVGVDLLAQALAKEKSVYHAAVTAIQAVLGSPDPAVVAAATELVRNGPPQELVGLEPYPSLGGRR